MVHLDTNLLFRQPVGRVLIIREKPRLLVLTAPKRFRRGKRVPVE
jgi:hypothetical protein